MNKQSPTEHSLTEIPGEFRADEGIDLISEIVVQALRAAGWDGTGHDFEEAFEVIEDQSVQTLRIFKREDPTTSFAICIIRTDEKNPALGLLRRRGAANALYWAAAIEDASTASA